MSEELAFPATSEYWSVVDSLGNLQHSGRLAPNQVLTTPFAPIIHADNENAYLDELNQTGPAEEALPPAGTPLEADELYAWNGQNVIVRQDHIRTEHAPDTVPALFSVYRVDYDGMDWMANESVMVGDERTYESVVYACIQHHTTQIDWTPPATPTLWAVVPSETGEWQAGVAYAIDDEVTYQTITYTCLQAHTAQVGWEPPAVPALWSVV